MPAFLRTMHHVVFILGNYRVLARSCPLGTGEGRKDQEAHSHSAIQRNIFINSRHEI